MYNMTIMEAREMSKWKLELELRKRVDYLKNTIGFTHVEACEFVSGIMNIGIALQEKQNKHNDVNV